MRKQMIQRLSGVVFALVCCATATAQVVVYVDGATGDDANSGTSEAPFRTIQRGVNAASSLGGGTVEVRAGDYDQGDGQVRILSGVTLSGQGDDQTTIFSHDTCAVEMDGNSSISGFRIVPTGLIGICATFAEGAFVHITHCKIDGPGFGAGIEVSGGTEVTSWIMECRINWFQSGIITENSGINISRCQFQNIIGQDIFAQTSFKTEGDTAPLLGNADDIENTGLNSFSLTSTLAVKNETTEEIKAEANDWGVYSEDAIAARVTGNVASEKFLSKGIGPGSVVTDLVGSSGEAIPQSASPSCTISALSMTGTYDSSSEKYIFNGVSEGTWQVQASAMGYSSGSASVTVDAQNISGVTVRLTSTTNTGTGSCGAKDGSVVYASSALVILASGARRRRRARLH